MFEVIDNPTDRLLDEIQALAPANPFQSSRFARARGAGGCGVLAMLIRGEGRLVAGCSAFLASGRINRHLEIQSLPTLPPQSEFWDGLTRWCRQRRISKLTLNSFGSDATAIPCLGREIWRKARTEYVLDLTDGDPAARLKSNHKRNVRRARKAGLALRIGTGREASRAHARLVGLSMTRRRDRGEAVDTGASADAFQILADSGAGSFYQVNHDGETVSSILVLTAPDGAYYHSAGTTPEGMSMGASHMLVDDIAASLRAAGMSRFNLGGTDPDQEGLIRFKTGFGARPVALESARFDFAGATIRLAEAIGRVPALFGR